MTQRKIEESMKIVKKISAYVNGNYSKTEFCKNMEQEHRYLQYVFTKLCIDWLLYCASDGYRYDGRNEYCHMFGQKFKEKMFG